MKYIFVTGGVVSGLGKGICAASLGRLLKQCGLRVKNQKFDPYLNVDPGTMSPYQHGEVFVTDDGAETDLDLGHYERFVDEALNANASVSSGKVYWSVLNRERQGGYLGGTVQIIPHVTDEIKSRVYAMDDGETDVCITEIGGTVGDIESQPFLEAIRQVAAEKGRGNVLFIHVPLIVSIPGSGELKSKPTQHSVKELLSLGIQPDILVCRTDSPLPDDVRHKIALFCNVEPECVIPNVTASTLYEVPLLLEDAGREFKDDSQELRDYFGEGRTWYIYGGHRLWSSPESYPHSYVPDNEPVEYTVSGGEITLIPPATRTGQQHRLIYRLADEGSEVELFHEIRNVSGAIVTLAPWALTVCAAGGVEIFPQSQADNGLLSNRRNVFWSYSDISDDRFFLSNRYGTLQQVKGAPEKFKIGINNEDGWAAVVNNGQIFLKNFRMNINGNYPDYGCNFETFTNGIFLECESLGELKTLKNGESASITEYWSLIPCSEGFDRKSDDSIDAFVKKYDLRNHHA